MSVRIWDLDSEDERIKLRGHTDTIFSLAWSSDGKLCSTVCKDGKIRVYDPRSSADPITEGCGLEGTRGGRIVWVCRDSLLAVTGFDRMSVRQVAVYNVSNLSVALEKVDLDTSPAILVPHYDEDSSVLFVTGRGDSTVRTFEICTEPPHINALSNFKGDGLHQALSFLPKNQVNVRNVEFARCMRLTSNSIEPVSFRVPRLRTEFFQDDLFPDTHVTWEQVLTSTEWFAGENGFTRSISLRPPDMQPLSLAPAEPAKRQKYESFEVYAKAYKTDEQKKEELLSALTNKLQVSDEPLPQDLTEGCDPDEWDD
jgi:coronin-7